MQIRRLCESLPEEAPEGAELEALLAHPNHVLARLSRDIAKRDVIVANFEKPMQVCVPAYRAIQARCDCKTFSMLRIAGQDHRCSK